MKIWLLFGVAFTLLAASPIHAQESLSENQLAQLFSRTEMRARSARQNFERLISEYPIFLPELQAVAARLGIRPEWLLNVIACESSFVPSARNPLPKQTASGLMQIIEQTALRLGTTTARIRRMNPVDQLHLVEKFYWPFRGRLNSLADVYLAAFRGFLLKGGPETVVAPLNDSRKEHQAYSLNSGLDLNRNGEITKKELAAVAFGVGRFGDTQSFGVEIAHITNSRQEKASEPSSLPPALSMYVTTKIISDSIAGSSPTEKSRTRNVAPKTRSIYVR